MPIDATILAAIADAAKLSTAQLDRICQVALGVALTSISNGSTPAKQAADMISYAVQYDLVRELTGALLSTSADSPGLQNLLLGDTMPIQPEESHESHHSLNLLRLENKVERLADKVEVLAHKVDDLLQRPLNWNIIGWGLVIAVSAGFVLWMMAVIK